MEMTLCCFVWLERSSKRDIWKGHRFNKLVYRVIETTSWNPVNKNRDLPHLSERFERLLKAEDTTSSDLLICRHKYATTYIFSSGNGYDC
ncbi:hypothetical protein SLA2020_446180 [Shorea laevis]